MNVCCLVFLRSLLCSVPSDMLHLNILYATHRMGIEFVVTGIDPERVQKGKSCLSKMVQEEVGTDNVT